MAFGFDASHFNRCQDRQDREAQFSEDIRTVMSGGCGPSSMSKSRTRSPGLAAGAALALGSTQPGQEARSQCQRALADERRRGCPWDSHEGFGDGGCKPPKGGGLTPYNLPVAPKEEQRGAFQAAHSVGKRNRDLQQRIGAGAPFDAPETAPTFVGRGATPPLPPSMGGCFAEAQHEALQNKTRMRGTHDLIQGGYLQGDSAAAKRSGSLPPRPELLPQAQMRLAMNGVSTSNMSHGRAEYLNSKVLVDANRERNAGSFGHLVKLG